MSKIEKVRSSLNKIPEFSSKTYSIVGYVIAAVVTIAGGYLIYNVVTTDALVFKANWNMFSSPLGSLCWMIGFIWAMAWWGKFVHWSQIPIIEKRDRYGNVIERKENMDVVEQMFAKIALPFLGHFGLEPLMYGAVIYYPIQCIIAIVGAIFPYILSIIVLAIIVGAWLFTRTFQFRYHSVVLIVAGLLFTVAFAWGGYIIKNNEPGNEIQMLTSNTQSLSASNDYQTYESATNDGKTESVESNEDEGGQFEGVGEEGLFGSLPNGTTEYVGDMAGFPIEFSITKSDNMGSIKAIYKNVKYGTKMNLDGESLPAQAGDISFYGKDGNVEWIFNLTGDVTKITGNAQGNGKEFSVTLNRK